MYLNFKYTPYEPQKIYRLKTNLYKNLLKSSLDQSKETRLVVSVSPADLP